MPPRIWLDGRSSRMARSALRDQLDGGFARYSVTADWSVPHFEKMLYDNAHCSCLWPLGAVGGDEVFPAAKRRMCLTMRDWMLESLGVAMPGIGSFRLSWTPTPYWTAGITRGPPICGLRRNLREALGADDGPCGAADEHWPEGTVSELASPLHRGGLADAGSAVDRIRPLLLPRVPGPQPARDDKVVAGWNGLAVAGLAEAGAVLGRPDLVRSGALAGYLATGSTGSPGEEGQGAGPGTLMRVSHAGRARGIGGLLEDYAFCADGFLALYGVTGTARWYLLAEEPSCSLRALRFVRERTAWRTQTGESAQVFNAQGQRVGLDPFDNATPSGAAGFAGALLS